MRGTVDLRRLIGDLREADGNVTFVIGAGASITAGIPLASKLVEEIQARFPRRLDGLTESERTNYGRVMGCLAPAQREELISPYLERAKLNWGHIALASLIAESKVKRVLTFNFDLILEKALALLGRHVAVYDFGMMPTKQINRLVEPSIVHLHGQGYGMKLLNSEEETRTHCENLRPLFGTALRESLTVVLGYGGNSDPVLEVMATEYDSRYPLYWLGRDETASEHLSKMLTAEDATYLGGCDFDWVMTRVAEGLEAWPPSILANPMRHVREVLAPTTDYPIGDETALDILQEARHRLAAFEADWESQRTPEQRALESSMGAPEAASALEGSDLTDLSDAAKLALAWRYFEVGNELAQAARNDDGDAAREKFQAAIRKFAAAVAVRPNMHEAINNWGAALVDASKHSSTEEALAMLNVAEGKFAEAIAIKPDKYETFSNWGNALRAVAKYAPPEVALEKMKAAREKYDISINIQPENPVILSNYGALLRELARLQPSSLAMEMLKESKGKLDKALTVKPDLFPALINAGSTLVDMAKLATKDDAKKILKEAETKFNNSLSLKVDIATSLDCLSTTLCTLASISGGEDRARALISAEEKVTLYISQTGKTPYNLACIHALRGEAAKAVAALVACRADGLLPAPAYLDGDTDLDSIRDDPAYRAFRAGLEPPPI